MKESIVTNVYHIDAEKKVPLHKHPRHDEIFYCIKGHGFGVLEDGEKELAVGKAFIVAAGTMMTYAAVPLLLLSLEEQVEESSDG